MTRRAAWWRERDAGFGAAHSYRMTLLHRERSAHQDIAIYEHPALGRVLVLDGLVQAAQADEFAYHEMAVHVALCARPGPAPASVLVVGGGDGGVLREALRHDDRSVARAATVEIDERVVAAADRWLGIQGDRADPRAELHIADAADFLAADARLWDVVILDLTEPVGPSRRLFSPEFRRALAARLAPGGVVVDSDSVVLTAAGPRFLQELCAGGAPNLARAMARAGAPWSVSSYSSVVPSFPGGPFAFFLYAREERDWSVPVRAMTGRHYNAAVHRAAFALPEWWDALFQEPGDSSSQRSTQRANSSKSSSRSARKRATSSRSMSK